jgi:large subunit ribosomal protein L4
MRNANEFVEKSGRNIAGVKIVRVEGLSVYDILHCDTVVFEKEALERIEEVLS